MRSAILISLSRQTTTIYDDETKEDEEIDDAIRDERDNARIAIYHELSIVAGQTVKEIAERAKLPEEIVERELQDMSTVRCRVMLTSLRDGKWHKEIPELE